jgi:hypothetical protein
LQLTQALAVPLHEMPHEQYQAQNERNVNERSGYMKCKNPSSQRTIKTAAVYQAFFLSLFSP